MGISKCCEVTETMDQKIELTQIAAILRATPENVTPIGEWPGFGRSHFPPCPQRMVH